MRTKAIYMRHPDGREKWAGSRELADKVLAPQGFVEADPPEERPRKRPGRTKDYYFTPNFQGW